VEVRCALIKAQAARPAKTVGDAGSEEGKPVSGHLPAPTSSGRLTPVLFSVSGGVLVQIGAAPETALYTTCSMGEVVIESAAAR
jgi:hypothetical protein